MVPAHACQVWVEGDTLVALFPRVDGHSSSHEIRLKNDAQGHKALASILQARAKAQAQLRIGHTSCPTQQDAERLRAMSAGLKITTIVSTRVKATPEALLKAKHKAEMDQLFAELEL